jgi:hypothetical protein
MYNRITRGSSILVLISGEKTSDLDRDDSLSFGKDHDATCFPDKLIRSFRSVEDVVLSRANRTFGANRIRS